MTQTFVNPFNAASEDVFMFPLPEQGTVHGMKYPYLKYMDGDVELAFPTLIGPRYPSGPGTPGSWNPPKDRDGPGFQFNVLLQSGVDFASITSPSHPIEMGEISVMKTALVERQVMGA